MVTRTMEMVDVIFARIMLMINHHYGDDYDDGDDNVGWDDVTG